VESLYGRDLYFWLVGGGAVMYGMVLDRGCGLVAVAVANSVVLLS